MPVVQIDARDATPIYAQLDRALRAAIAAGRLQPGDQLPTVRQLAVDLRINANTVARVYAELERDGVLETRRGVGTFIRAPAAETAFSTKQRERMARALVDRFLTEAASVGLTAPELLAELAGRIKK